MTEHTFRRTEEVIVWGLDIPWDLLETLERTVAAEFGRLAPFGVDIEIGAHHNRGMSRASSIVDLRREVAARGLDVRTVTTSFTPAYPQPGSPEFRAMIEGGGTPFRDFDIVLQPMYRNQDLKLELMSFGPVEAEVIGLVKVVHEAANRLNASRPVAPVAPVAAVPPVDAIDVGVRESPMAAATQTESIVAPDLAPVLENRSGRWSPWYSSSMQDKARFAILMGVLSGVTYGAYALAQYIGG